MITTTRWVNLPFEVQAELKRRFGDSAEFMHSVVSEDIDQQLYLLKYPDVHKQSFDPAAHYLLHGFFEGRDPHPEFDALFYLNENPDVHAAGVNPYVHYLTEGRREGRLGRRRNEQPSVALTATGVFAQHMPTPPPEERSAEPIARSVVDQEEPEAPAEPIEFEFWRDYMARHFSPEFYHSMYPDIAEANIDPWHHYFYTGWKEGRSPTWDFDPSDYLKRYADVAASKIEPYFHYIAAGKQEGRIGADPLLREFKHLESAPIAMHMAKGAELAYGFSEIRQIDVDALVALIGPTTKCSRGFVISLSHDDVLRSVGGVQNCVRDELDRFVSAGYSYLHLYPARPLLRPLDADETYDVGLSLNGRPIAWARFEILAESLSKIGVLQQPSPPAILCHSLMGHCANRIAKLAKQAAANVYLWAHDYALVCINFLLTRNEMSFCGAPEPQAASCQICTFNLRRVEQLSVYRHFVQKTNATLISPSPFANSVLAKDPVYGAARRIVLGHCELVPMGSESKTNNPTPLTIAYLGYEQFHKGWSAWLHLVSAVKGRSDVRLLHLGKRQTVVPEVEFFEVSVSQGNRNAMVEAVRSHNVDFAFIWPNWPETYSYITYEAIAAGAKVLTNEISGNVYETVADTNYGVVYSRVEELASELATGAVNLRKLVASKQYFDISYNPGLYHVVNAESERKNGFA